jgi:hypothetical protein
MSKIELPRISKYKRVYPKSLRPQPDDNYPMTERYYHKAFSDQGLTSAHLTLDQIEQACLEYSLGDRRKRQETDIYEVYEFFEDFVHDDDKHNSLRKGEREYEPDFNDGDGRWSFSYVK